MAQFLFFETGAWRHIKEKYQEGQIIFFIIDSKRIEGAEVIFIAVGTPPGEDGSADLRHVLDVAEEIGASLKNYSVICTKSTVPVGTAGR